MKKIELLAPAKNLECGTAAINAGADAVYIGAGRFGARAAAGNSIEDIEVLARYAHQYFARVYVAINTLIYGDETAEVEALCRSAAEAGADALIIQDLGILEMNLPKDLPLIASTQADCYTPERIKFLEKCGFSRVILARELNLQQIKKIRSTVSCELECFIFGALCVSRSGLCYMSRAANPNSGANRGSCSQMCRHMYSLHDFSGNTVAENKYLLSLRDLNLENHISELIDSGITSFKIEGRLKDLPYAVNTTAYFRKKIDSVLEDKAGKFARSSSGKSEIGFTPNVNKTFNRSFSEFMYSGNSANLANFVSPKSIGEFVGTLSKSNGKSIKLNTRMQINSGDGFCYEHNGELAGFRVNTADEDGTLHISEYLPIPAGTKIYRNFDIAFEKALSLPIKRTVSAEISINESPDGIRFTALDEDEITAEIEEKIEKIPARNPEAAARCRNQLAKSGGTCFEIDKINGEFPYFIPLSAMNETRRKLLDLLLKNRLAQMPKNSVPQKSKISVDEFSFPDSEYLNITNPLAEKFYSDECNLITKLSPEVTGEFDNFPLMTTAYCLRRELGICPRINPAVSAAEPLILSDERRKYRIEFECGACGMKIFKK